MRWFLLVCQKTIKADKNKIRYSLHAHINIYTLNRTCIGIYFIYECMQYTHALIHLFFALVLSFFALAFLLYHMPMQRRSQQFSLVNFIVHRGMHLLDHY